MARGWESKSVEDQVAQHEIHLAKSPAPNKVREDLSRKRDIQSLQLQRERILSERTSSPVRRAALGAALAEIEGRLKALGVDLSSE